MSVRSIKKILMYQQLAIAMLILLLTTCCYIINDFFIFKNSVLENQHAMANILVRNLAASVSFNDQEEAQRVLDSLKANPIIIKASVTTKNGEQFAVYQANKEDSLGGNSFETKVLIQEGNESLGELAIISRFNLIKAFSDKYFTIISFTMLFSILLSYILARYMQQMISNPLRSFMKKITSLGESQSRPETQIRLLSTRVKEFEELHKVFDQMANKLQERDLAIKQYTENLEATVEAKTKELIQEKSKQVQNGKLMALGEMASGIAHEINNPLAIITGSISILSMMLEDDVFDKDKFSKTMTRIESTAFRISKIIKGLRNISRDASADEYEESKIKELLNDTLVFCTQRFSNHNVQLIIEDFPDDLSIWCQPVEISQVMLNLLNNSFDAVEHLPERWVKFEVIQENDQIVLAFTDSGKGIPAEIREKILEPFYTTKPVGKGTGLGLSISKGIIEKHGGQFIINAQHPNTQFLIKFPINKRKQHSA